MAGWHHQLNGCEFEWTPGVGDGQGSLAWRAAIHGVAKSQTQLSDWTELNCSELAAAAAAKEVTNLFNFIESKITSRPWNWYCLLLHCYCFSWKWFSVWLYVYHFLNRHCSERWITTLNRSNAFILSWYLVRVLFYFILVNSPHEVHLSPVGNLSCFPLILGVFPG